MKTYIPTYRRQRQRTWENMSPAWRAETVLVCDELDAASLDAAGYPVLLCPVQGNISRVRQWIIDQHDVNRDGAVLVMADDDLSFAMRRFDNPGKFVPAVDTDQMMELFKLLMRQVPFGGIANRSGSNNLTPPVAECIRIGGFYGINVEVARANGVTFTPQPMMVDFHFALQLLLAGYPTASLTAYCMEAHASNAAGGCSLSRTPESQAAAARSLAARYPAYVKTREAAGWKGIEKRLDVRVQWAKARKAGQEARDILGLPQIIPDWGCLCSASLW